MRIFQGSWQRREPSFRLPFPSVFAPQLFVAIARLEMWQYHGSLWNSEFADHLTVSPAHRIREREYEVLRSPVSRKLRALLSAHTCDARERDLHA